MKKTILNLKVLKIEHDGFHLAAKILVNRKSALMVLDTGASRTVFDKNRIGRFSRETKFRKSEQQSAGLGTSTMKSHFTALKKISLGKISIADYDAVLLDLSHVNKAYAGIGLPEVDGVLGNDILVKFRAKIDYGKKKLELFY